ncbi:MAG: lysylphosphatidylglycerol synthase domain-containing protein [Nanoarchaeota archaeon]|nr:lysylphosphatidylglycerol synthase domain-containing protein [Nanoarchaeota archaeon]
MDFKKRKTNKILSLISYLVVVVIFYFLIKTLFVNWQRIKDYKLSFNYLDLLVAFVCGVSSVIVLSLVWRKIIKKIDSSAQLSYRSTFKIYVYAWIGRYVPGKIWIFVGKIYLGVKERLKFKTLALASFLELALYLISQSLLSLFFLIFYLREVSIFQQEYIKALLFVLIFLLLIVVHPNILSFAANKALRIFKKDQIPRENFLSYGAGFGVIIYYFFPSVLYGLSFVFLLKSFFGLPGENIMLVLGSFVLANIIGEVALFAPVGLGIREGVLVGLLQLFIPLPIAILASLLSRIWFILIDLFLLLCNVGMGIKTKGVSPTTANEIM